MIEQNRMPALDGLRGVAILLVILTHAGEGWRRALMIVQDSDWMAPLQLPGWLAIICQRGVFGVTLFFIVSACTLTMQAGRRGDGWFAYVVRRVARVGPGYWLAGLAYSVLAGLGPRVLAPEGVTLSDLGVAAVFGSAWQGGAALAVVPGGWSVSCEVAFYAALPILLWAVRGSLPRAIGLTALAGIGVQLAGRHAIQHGGITSSLYFHPLIQAPVFLCGIAAAIFAQRVPLPRLPGLAIMLSVVAIAGLPLLSIRDWYLLPHLAFAGVAAAAVALAARHPPSLLTNTLIRRLGEVSYSMYLLHFTLLAPALWLAERVAPSDDWLTLVLHMTMTTGASFALARLTYRWIEQPGIAFGRTIIRRLGRPVTQVPLPT